MQAYLLGLVVFELDGISSSSFRKKMCVPCLQFTALGISVPTLT
jgi:hypothetical protein